MEKSKSMITEAFSSIVVQKELFNMLDAQDFVNLLSLNKQIKQELVLRTPILSKLYFLTFLKQREMFTYVFCDIPAYKKFQQQKVDTLLSNADCLGTVSSMKAIKNQMVINLTKICCADKSVQIVDNVFETMINPEIPMPNLRKETVGDYCNSALQLLMAQLNWRENTKPIQQQPFRSLKEQMLNNHENILEELKDNDSLLIKIRFQPELINKYTKTNSAFLNIIIGFLYLIDQHLVSIRKYLELHQERQNFQFLSQFIKRYNTFRDMVIEFQDKLGFVFELFTKAFNYLQPQLQIYPGCSVWRALMKKWVTIMKPFETKLSEGYTQLLSRGRQHNFEQMIEQENKLQECSARINVNYLMKNKKSEQIVSQELKIIMQEDRDAVTIILTEYSEYLIDTSVNEYSVHWCESSCQKLNSIYNNNQRKIIDSTVDLYQNWSKIFQDSLILRQVYEHDINYLKNIIKPTTLSLLIQKANIFISQKLKNSLKLISGDFQHIDSRIKSLNQKRMIPLELESQYQPFFDFDKTISLNKIESIIKNISGICQDTKIERTDNNLVKVEE